MAQILPRDTIAERLGTGLGAGVNTGLNTLLNYKIQQMTKGAERDQSYKNLVNSGYDPSVARFISGYDPKEQIKLLTNLWQRGYNPGGNASAAINNEAAISNQPENIQNTMQELGQGQQPTTQEILAPQPQASPQSIAELFAQQAPQFVLPNQPMNAAALGAVNELRKGLTAQIPAKQPEEVKSQVDKNLRQQPTDINLRQQQPQKPQTVADILSKPPPPSPDTQAKLNQQQEQFDKKFKHDLNKEASKFLDPYSDKAEASRRNIRDYNMVIAAAKKGDLRAGNIQVALDKLGWGDYGKNLTTQIVEKSLARLAQNAGSAFGQGTRLTNYLEQTYQRSLARLWNTPEGIIAISEINKLIDEGNLLQEQEAVNLLKENNGEKPFNAKQLVAERVQPQLDALAQKAIDILEPQKYTVLSVQPNLPNASSSKGKKFRDTVSGEIFISDGNKWTKQ